MLVLAPSNFTLPRSVEEQRETQLTDSLYYTADDIDTQLGDLLLESGYEGLIGFLCSGVKATYRLLKQCNLPPLAI